MIITGRIDSREVDRLLDQLRERSINLRPALNAIEQEIVNGIEDIFEQEGPGWPKLSPVTERHRRLIGKSGKILDRDGDLALAVQTGNQITSDSVTVTNDKLYAPFVHFGTKQNVTAKQQKFLAAALGMHVKVGKEIVNPARPFMLITKEAEDESVNILADHLVGKL